MSNEVKQLRLQLKERDARISQLEAEYKALEAQVADAAHVLRQAKEIVNAYTTGLHVIAALAEQTKDS